METSQAILLALLQGLTEFLPISSSAHLILPSQLLGWTDQGLAFDVAVHVGTLAAVVIYFRKDVLAMAYAWCNSLVSGVRTSDSRLAWFVILGTIPAGVAGFLANGFVENFLRSTWVIASATIFFGLLLYVAERMGSHQRVLAQLSFKDVFFVGVAQALALIPGTSRSGITMTAAIMLGLNRTAAARVSFLLSIPIICAAGLLKLFELLQSDHLIDWTNLLIGLGTSFISAYLCIGWFLKVIDRIGMMPFVIYRLVLGIILFLFLYKSATL
ncbi:MAG: undecaprenyl-diphosphate phosphatase [Pseudomonadales bacterium]|nr:undecaprenyl-diphosphate phosphatase [Pseudomonadales bacterium]